MRWLLSTWSVVCGRNCHPTLTAIAQKYANVEWIQSHILMLLMLFFGFASWLSCGGAKRMNNVNLSSSHNHTSQCNPNTHILHVCGLSFHIYRFEIGLLRCSPHILLL
jgi:hypothetical protein